MVRVNGTFHIRRIMMTEQRYQHVYKCICCSLHGNLPCFFINVNNSNTDRDMRLPIKCKSQLREHTPEFTHCYSIPYEGEE